MTMTPWDVKGTDDSQWLVYNTITGETFMQDGSESIANFYAAELNSLELEKLARIENDTRISNQGIGF